MTSKDFQEFLAKQSQNKQQDEQIDWDETRNKWIASAREFVAQVQLYLNEFPEIETEVREIDLTEDKLGTYKAPKLLIRLPKELIELEPIGTVLIGAHGRFDMKGLAGTVKWVLVPENAEKPTIKMTINGEDESSSAAEQVSEKLAWKLATPAPNIRYLPFEKEILLEAIMEVSHG